MLKKFLSKGYFELGEAMSLYKEAKQRRQLGLKVSVAITKGMTSYCFYPEEFETLTIEDVI